MERRWFISFSRKQPNSPAPSRHRPAAKPLPSASCRSLLLPVITSGAIQSGAVNLPMTYTITATNSPSSYGASGLPAGLSLNTSTGVISGTPTAAGVNNVQLSATANSSTGTGNVVFDILQSTAVPVINSPTAETASVGASFTYQISAANAPVQFGATGLPAGFTLVPSTGLISGTPTTARRLHN